ncbi:MAG TPA: hypothetical protein PKI17_05990 [Syntrophomonas sp.]|nr:hypothetical protein [Syntrophomonas sp.]
MPQQELVSFDKIQKYLLEKKEVAALYLTEAEMDIRHRIATGFTAWVEYPIKPEKDIVSLLMEQFDISQRQAYNDVFSIKMMLGNVKNAHKEWYRYMVIEMAKETYQKAKELDDAKAMAMALDKIGKYTRLDQVDAEALPWDQLVPPNFEPSSDITVLGFKHDPNLDERRKRLKRKYLQEIEDAELID